MTTSPFQFGTIVSQNAFTNREAEIAQLYNNLTQGIHTILISPRRWGKSSLVKKVVADIHRKDKSKKTITIDLFRVSSREEFLELFAREIIKASSTKWEEWVGIGKTFFKQLIPKFSVGVDPAHDFSVSFNWNELEKHPDEVLNLAESIAAKKGIQYIICLDEFQNLASFKGYADFEKKMRAIWQQQKRVCYCLYGSKHHMMTDIFQNASKPFYRFGDTMFLQKIATSKWVPFITRNFKKTSKSIATEDAKLIAVLMKNHPWYVQQLCHYVWHKTLKTATKKEITLALNELIAANIPFFQVSVESLPQTRLNLLKVVAKGEKQYYKESIRQKYRVGTPNLIRKNIRILEEDGILTRVTKGHEFLDPAFELWFKQQFLGEAFTAELD